MPFTDSARLRQQGMGDGAHPQGIGPGRPQTVAIFAEAGGGSTCSQPLPSSGTKRGGSRPHWRPPVRRPARGGCWRCRHSGTGTAGDARAPAAAAMLAPAPHPNRPWRGSPAPCRGQTGRCNAPSAITAAPVRVAASMMSGAPDSPASCKPSARIRRPSASVLTTSTVVPFL